MKRNLHVFDVIIFLIIIFLLIIIKNLIYLMY